MGIHGRQFIIRDGVIPLKLPEDGSYLITNGIDGYLEFDLKSRRRPLWEVKVLFQSKNVTTRGTKLTRFKARSQFLAKKDFTEIGKWRMRKKRKYISHPPPTYDNSSLGKYNKMVDILESKKKSNNYANRTRFRQSFDNFPPKSRQVFNPNTGKPVWNYGRGLIQHKPLLLDNNNDQLKPERWVFETLYTESEIDQLCSLNKDTHS